MATKGMDRISISVSNLVDSLAFYRDWIGMRVVARETLEPKQIQQLWNLPPETKARAAILKNELQPTLLELIEFRPRSGRKIREGLRSLDYGLYDIAFLVRDIEQIYRELTEKGFTFISPPIQYQPNWVPHRVKEMVLIGPDNVRVAHFQRMKYEEYGVPGNYVKLNHSAQIVDDTDKAIKFYCDILGLDLASQVTVPKGLVDDVIGAPAGTETKLTFITRKDTDTVIMEFVELSLKGKSLAPVAKPPNLGLFMLSFEVDDLSSLMKTLQKEGITVLSGPVEWHTKSSGKMTAITVEGPGGVMVKLFEREVSEL